MDITEYFEIEFPSRENKKMLLSKIKSQKDKNADTYFDSGNVFDLDINFKENKVLIIENLFLETDKVLNLTLEEFYSEILKEIDN